MRPLVAVPDGSAIEILDQTLLPHHEEWRRLATVAEVAEAIRAMRVRGAPLIGITAAWGLALAMRGDPSDAGVERAVAELAATRPTAVNLRWALERVRGVVAGLPPEARAGAAAAEAHRMAEADVSTCRAIGNHGLEVIRALARDRPAGEPVRVLTHCNAGWLATLEYGTALAPVYRAHEEGLALHVWADETRPRNQGWLTAWELGRAGVSHAVVTDNASGHLLQRGEVDLVLVGTDRTARNGDVCNKIGTWLKALAADESGVPFYVGVPSSSIDWTAADGRDIPIEERDGGEVTHVRGADSQGHAVDVALGPAGTAVCNVAFDVTPARYVTGLITERGICSAREEGLLSLFPEHRR